MLILYIRQHGYVLHFYDMLHNLNFFLHKMLFNSKFFLSMFIVTFFISHALKFKYQSRTLEVNLRQHWA